MLTIALLLHIFLTNVWNPNLRDHLIYWYQYHPEHLHIRLALLQNVLNLHGFISHFSIAFVKFCWTSFSQYTAVIKGTAVGSWSEREKKSYLVIMDLVWTITLWMLFYVMITLAWKSIHSSWTFHVVTLWPETEIYFMWKTNTKWPTIVKYKEYYTQFYCFLQIKKLKTAVCKSIQLPFLWVQPTALCDDCLMINDS